jgi:hypothetical protein
MARAIRTGSAARVTAEATNTALQPNSIADIASLDVPIPASRRMTGTLVRSTMSEMLCGLRSRARNRSVSRPACAAQPTCSNRRANAGSSSSTGLPPRRHGPYHPYAASQRTSPPIEPWQLTERPPGPLDGVLSRAGDLGSNHRIGYRRQGHPVHECVHELVSSVAIAGTDDRTCACIYGAFPPSRRWSGGRFAVQIRASAPVFTRQITLSGGDTCAPFLD